MPKYLKFFPKPLLTDLAMGRWLPIIGAGMSKNAVVPSGKTVPLWDALGKALALEMSDYTFTNALDAISFYSHEYSRSKLVERLVDLLLLDEAKPGSVHKAFCSIPFDVVVTTNFDFLLEQQYTETPRYCRPILEESQLSIAGKRSHVTLLKMHGDLHHPQRLVVTEEDYDIFLEKYPLLATYLSSLLIARTAVMVGYSLEDPDFRQIWQVLTERLGRSRGPAYAIIVDASPSEVARFDRRGVKVINLPGSKGTYAKILTEAFNELRDYWKDNVLSASTITEEDPLRELSLPVQSTKRLCYFSVPVRLLSFYKDKIFPIAQRLGFVPITVDDIILPHGNLNAIIEALIDRAQTIVVDTDSVFTSLELRAILTRHSSERQLLVIGDLDGNFNALAYLSEYVPERLFYKSKFIDRKRRGRDFETADEQEEFLSEVEGWFVRVADDLSRSLNAEPTRLLNIREYRAAVISAMSLLENELRKLTKANEIYQVKRLSLINLLQSATQLEILNYKEYAKIREWASVRNRAVHEGLQIQKKQAQEIVEGTLSIAERLSAGTPPISNFER